MSPRVLFSAALFIAVILLATGCESDLDHRIPPPPIVPGPPESPQDVIDNFVYAFNQMDYERLASIIHDDFTFVFNEDDINRYPDNTPSQGVWGKEEFLQAIENIFDPNFVPEEQPSEGIDNIQMEMEFSGDPVPSNLEQAPLGTFEGYVTVDMRVSTTGATDCLVNSRPEFYYTPDSTKTPVLWQLWRIMDAPFGQPTTSVQIFVSSRDPQRSHASEQNVRNDITVTSSAASRRELSLGAVLAYFGRIKE
jgi:hypothetical protein